MAEPGLQCGAEAFAGRPVCPARWGEFDVSVRIIHGDCREVLKLLPSDSVHCCVTSPPYWRLRSYLPEGHPDKPKEIGSEPTLQAWVQTMVEVFREVRRVLRPDGTLWLNLGDSYASKPNGSIGATSLQGSTKPHAESRRAHGLRKSGLTDGLKHKDLCGQPWRVAFALQADGWWLRQEIIWSKANPMPESARDRSTMSHEQIFLLSKSSRYFYDFAAMQEPVSLGTHARMSQNVAAQVGSMRANGGDQAVRRPDPRPFKAGGRKLAEVGSGTKNNASFDKSMAVMPETRNSRSVWTLPTHPFKGAHFATFPPALAERCITAGCPVGGVVLDPFGGSGTVGLVADRQHKNAILIDLDERNVPMATERIARESSLFAEIESAIQNPKETA